MNRFPPNRMVLVVLVPLALFVCAERAQATDISGTITSTLTISDDSELVGDVTCNVPITAADANGVASCIAFGLSAAARSFPTQTWSAHTNGHADR